MALADKSMKIEGAEDLERRLSALGADVSKALEKAVHATAWKVRATAVKSIQAESFGSWVKRSKQGGGGTYDHIAAADGGAPNNDTGSLVKSLAVEKEKGKPTAYVGSSLDYALYLEFGTKRNGQTYMGAKPFLQPALDAHLPNLEQEIVKQAMNAIKAAAKKGGKKK